jgi:hypothetical protein
VVALERSTLELVPLESRFVPLLPFFDLHVFLESRLQSNSRSLGPGVPNFVTNIRCIAKSQCVMDFAMYDEKMTELTSVRSITTGYKTTTMSW